MDLALWFTHILAGNHYKLDWKYRKFHEEELVRAPKKGDNQPEPSHKRAKEHDGEVLLPRTRVTRNKRKHNEYVQSQDQQEIQDIAKFSFRENPLPQPTARCTNLHIRMIKTNNIPKAPANHYAADTQYDSEENSNEESYSPPIKRRLRSSSQRSESEHRR